MRFIVHDDVMVETIQGVHEREAAARKGVSVTRMCRRRWDGEKR